MTRHPIAQIALNGNLKSQEIRSRCRQFLQNRLLHSPRFARRLQWSLDSSPTTMAQDRCMPAGVRCAAAGSDPKGPPHRQWGTLEEFRRYSKIVCLKADAIENKNLPEAIEASSRCFAARIAAQRVEQEQQANAADHQRAMEARRQLREMGVEPPDPTTFPPDW